MKRLRSKRVLLAGVGLVVLLTGLCFWLAARDLSRRRLDRSLIAAIRNNDDAAVVSLLNRGADPNARDVGDSPVSIKALLRSLLRRLLGRPSEAMSRPSALGLAIEDYTSAQYPQRKWTIIQALLDKGADINARSYGSNSSSSTTTILIPGTGYYQWNEKGDTPLIAAILQSSFLFDNGNPPAGPHAEDLVRLLLEYGADINATDGTGRTPLMAAAYKDEDGLIQQLLDRGAAVNAKDAERNTALSLALDSLHYPQSIPILQAHGGRVDVHSRSGKNAFIGAARNRMTDLVEMMLDQGMDANTTDSQGDTALIQAIKNNDLDMVQLLLNKGADPNVPLPVSNYADAVWNGRTYWSTSGQTPLMCALGISFTWVDERMVKTLLDHGAHLNSRDAFGRTPLMWAVFYVHGKIPGNHIIPWLQARGADPFLKDQKGETAFSIARQLKEPGRSVAQNLLKQAWPQSANPSQAGKH